jgi:hypothetical protein
MRVVFATRWSATRSTQPDERAAIAERHRRRERAASPREAAELLAALP